MEMDWIDIGSLTSIPKAGARAVLTPAGRLALFRTADDKVFAMDDQCPHRGGPLSQGMVFGHQVSCAMHGMVIDLATGKAETPGEGCAAAFPVKVEKGRIWLKLSAMAMPRGAAEKQA